MATPGPETFVVDLGGFEGPLDLLLELARAEKVDLRHISILALADQFLAYLKAMRAQELHIAAEYLVMAAWLAYLKSQLLLPPPEREAPDPEALALQLGGHLRRLEALRRAAHELAARPRLGQERLPRGLPEGLTVAVRPLWQAGLGDLFQAYVAAMRRGRTVRMTVPQRRLVSLDAALEALSRQLTGRDWRDLASFLPASLESDLVRRSAVAAGLLAGLELARVGAIELRQTTPFGPIMVRRP